MKRFLAVFLAGIALLTLTSCRPNYHWLFKILTGEDDWIKPGTIFIISLIVGPILGWIIISNSKDFEWFNTSEKVKYTLLSCAIMVFISFVVLYILKYVFSLVVQGGVIIAIILIIFILINF